MASSLAWSQGCDENPILQSCSPPVAVHDVPVEDMCHGVAPRDDLGGVPPFDLEHASEVLLVADSLAAEHPGHAAVGGLEERGHRLLAGLRVGPGVELEAVEGDQVTHVGLLHLELERLR